MARFAWILLLSLSACSPGYPPSDPASRESWIRNRWKEALGRTVFAEKESYEHYADRLSGEFDRFLGGALNRYPEPPLSELRLALRSDSPVPPFVQMLACETLPGSGDLLLPYTLALGASAGSTRVRLARRQNGAYHLVRPPRTELRDVERELACWRGGDLQVRYGPPDHPNPFTIEDCCGTGPPVFLPSDGPGVLFALGYCIPSTCPSGFEIVWHYDRGELVPLGYAWDGTATKGWRRFRRTPLARLQEEIARDFPWVGK